MNTSVGRACLAEVVTVACCSVALSAPVIPHVYRGGLNMAPYGNTVSRAVTYWKNMVYVSADAETCYTGQPPSSATIFAVDVSNPDHVTYLSKEGFGGCKANGLVVVEDKLYVASWGVVLRIFDVSNPTSLTPLGEFAPAGRFGWDVRVSNQRAYVSEGRETGWSMYIFDVADPRHPVAVANPNEMGGSTVRGSYCYYTDGTWFKVLNLSDETQPYSMAGVDLRQKVGEVALRDPYAFVKLGWPPDAQTGMVVFDISAPAQPKEVGRWTVADGPGLRGIFLLGDLAFLPTSGNGFYSVDISNPARPVAVAQTEVPYYSLELAVTGNGQYVYVGTIENGGGLHAFQVLDRDPDDAGPNHWSSFSLGEASWDLQYEADALPTTADPPWTLIEGSDSWASVSGGILRINDTGTAPGDKVKWARRWDATNTRGTTVLARARCAAYDVGSAPMSYLSNIFVRDGTYIEDFAILSDRFRAHRANLEVPLDGTLWHTYRITTQGSQFQVFVDEGAAPVLTGPLFVSGDSDPDARWARVIIGSGSSASTQDISFDYVHCFSNAAVPPSPPVNVLAPTITVNAADAAGKGSLSGIDPTTARVLWSTDGGLTWSSSGDPAMVACAGVSTPGPPDRGTVIAYAVPFDQNSEVLNKVRFSLRDRAGNTGFSPIYNVRIRSAPPPPVTGLVAGPADRQVTLSWRNPSSRAFTGTMIRFGTAGFPASPSDGTLLVDQPGAPGSLDSYVHAGLVRGARYYYSVFAHSAEPFHASPGCVKARASSPADLDNDGDVDQADFGCLQACYAGSGQVYSAGCEDADLQGDGDVDQDDFAVFRACIGGADRPPGC